MAAPCVHHVQVAVRNGTRCVHKLISNINFHLFAQRKDVHRTDWVLKSGSAVFVVSEHRDETHQNPACEVAGHRRPGDRSPSGDASSRSSAIADIASPPPDSQTEPLFPTNHVRTNLAYTLGYVSPPLSSQCLDFELPKYAIGNIDTVCNVAFEVCDVEATVERAKKEGAEVLCEPKVVRDDDGYVTVAAVKSCVGNVVHTILNTQHYHGVFLPGFSQSKTQCNDSNSLSQSQKSNDGRTQLHPNCGETAVQGQTLTHFDHVTFAIPTGSSNEVLDWYERCFGMRRFWLERNEDKLEGFLVRGSNVGLRMKAMEYWRCAEKGLAFPAEANRGQQRLNGHGKEAHMMFVVAEAMPNQGPNQVETFIEQHGGPGIQHIGLYTPDIQHTVGLLKERGLDFMVPPAMYYTEVGKLQEIVAVGKDPTILQQLGILLDAEDFVEEETENDEERKGGDHNGIDQEIRYLMQVFTRPFFDRDTFFLEIIQRQGASGFGAGNIKALWKSVEAYMAQKEGEPSDSQAEKTNGCLSY